MEQKTSRIFFGKRAIGALLLSALLQGLMSSGAQATPMVLSPTPLNIGVGSTPNVLLILDNSNSMDEAPDGTAACPATTTDITTAQMATPCTAAAAVTVGGSGSPLSKSEIARSAARTIVKTYGASMNIGLMAYQQSNVLGNYYIYNSWYDASFDPNNYLPAWDLAVTGARATGSGTDARNFPGSAATPVAHPKKYRFPNPSNAANFVYYNVSAPFYQPTRIITPEFCYSTAAVVAANQFPAGFPNGFWNPAAQTSYTYNCWPAKTDINDTIPGTGGTIAANTGFFPTDSDLAASINAFGHWVPNTASLGSAWFSNDATANSANGYLHVPIALAPTDSAHYNALMTKLGTSQFANNQPTNAAYPLQNAGNTPMAGALKTANAYFQGTLTAAAQGSANCQYTVAGNYNAAAAAAIPCVKNFIVYLTDGMPSISAAGVTTTDPAAALHEVVQNASNLLDSDARVQTYVIGFGAEVDADQLNTIAKAGDPNGTRQAYSANDAASLNQAMTLIFQNIVTQISAGSAVASNSSQLIATSAIYQASFDSSNWSGHLRAYSINTSGAVSAAPTWDAATVLPVYPNRNIVTYSDATHQGIPFAWGSLSSTQKAQLNNQANLLAWLAGDSSKEGTGTPAAPYRQRLATNKLGDIVDSAPIYVGKPAMGYNDAIESAATSPYSAWAAGKANRTPMVYVGANDGMLHGFAASTGKETFAYVPGAMYSTTHTGGGLALLAAQDYTHRFYVDGSPTVSDACLTATGAPGGSCTWTTVLVGGYGAGGQGIYALNVTDPDGVLSSATNAPQAVMWEYTSDADANLGYTFSVPQITKLRGSGQWVAIFGNGYNSASGHAVLYVVNLVTGVPVRTIDTGVGPGADGKPNGLSTPAVVTALNDGQGDYVYAGDLRGNMWMFDLSDANPDNWKIGHSNQALYSARSSSNAEQPITEKPEVGRHPNGGYMVYFGTGKYVEVSDPADTTQQTFYGIWDRGSASASDGVGRTSSMLQQVITLDTTSSWRFVTSNAPNWIGTPPTLGWYVDLPTSGERSVSDPQLNNGRIIFTTAIPPTNACGGTGDGWLMELDAMSGGALTSSPFDVNGDNQFTALDKASPASGGSLPPMGTWLNDGTSAPLILTLPDGNQVKVMNKSDGSISTVRESAGNANSRMSWRDLSQPQ